MNELSYLEAVLLGAIQGITEFLPISSSAHLAIVQRWLDLDPDNPAMLLFDVCAHLGTLVAIAFVFMVPLNRFVRRLASECRPERGRPRLAWRLVALAVVATIPTGVIGLAFQERFEAAFDRPGWIGAGLIVTGMILATTTRLRRCRSGWRAFRWWQALAIGLAQAAAILPGISRSGSTICVALLCGWRRRWAAEFSFLIAAPAIVGGTVKKMIDTLAPEIGLATDVPWGPILVGGLASLILGIAALVLLLHAVRRAKLHYFAVYCWVGGLLVLTKVL